MSMLLLYENIDQTIPNKLQRITK